MPRKAREKYPEAIYHIMCRSESEFLLFRDDEDNDYYLGLLKRFVDKFKSSIYAYCMMDSHLHVHLDPKGFDVSKFMLCGLGYKDICSNIHNMTISGCSRLCNKGQELLNNPIEGDIPQQTNKYS